MFGDTTFYFMYSGGACIQTYQEFSLFEIGSEPLKNGAREANQVSEST